MRNLIILLCMALPSLSAVAGESDWGFTGMITYGPRSIEGTIFVSQPGPIMGGATADSLGLGTSNSFMFAAGFDYKRWNVMLTSMPTSFDGQGFATIGIDLGDGQVIAIDTPTKSTIAVDLTLANVMYRLLDGKYGEFSVGVGFGQTNIDVLLDPLIGQSVGFDGKTPFGFLAVNYRQAFGKFSLTAAAQGISITANDSSMTYSNLNLMGGYMFFEKKWYSEVVVGYRRVGFEFDYDVSGGVADTDVVLTGPYVGLIFGWK